MRSMVYLAAITIAAGLIYYIGNSPLPELEGETAAPASRVVALDVPDMQCAFGCYPTVKEVLTGMEGVQNVRLAEQKSEDQLDDKTVFVSYCDPFDLDVALKNLSEAGFAAQPIENP